MPGEGAHFQYTSNHHGMIPTGDLGRRCHYVNTRFPSLSPLHVTSRSAQHKSLIVRRRQCFWMQSRRYNKLYRRDFEIAHLLMDGQFEPIRGDLSSLGITLNTVANDKHVPEVERYIRTLKE